MTACTVLGIDPGAILNRPPTSRQPRAVRRHVNIPGPNLVVCRHPSKAKGIAPNTIPDTTPNIVPDTTPDTIPDTIPNTIPNTTPNIVPDTTPNTIPDTIPNTTPNIVPNTIPDTIPNIAPRHSRRQDQQNKENHALKKTVHHKP